MFFSIATKKSIRLVEHIIYETKTKIFKKNYKYPIEKYIYKNANYLNTYILVEFYVYCLWAILIQFYFDFRLIRVKLIYLKK